MGRDNMNHAQPIDETGRLEARYSAFLETITSLTFELTPLLCMTGSVMSEKGKITLTLQDTFLGRSLSHADPPLRRELHV